MKWLRCAAGMFALAATACTAPPVDPASLDEVAEGYVRAALELAQHQPTLVENWRGNADWRPGPRQPVAALRARLTTLRSTLAQTESRGAMRDANQRGDYLRRQLAALDLAARRLLGESTPFAEEVAAALSQRMPSTDDAGIEAARDTLARLLQGAGTLGERHAAFRRTVVVPADRAADVLGAAITACRERTRAHIALPAEETVDLRLGVDSPWDGFARYQGDARSTIEIGGRSPLDVSRALHLACHEAYPGHHTQEVLLSLEAARSGRAELLLQPAFGAHLLIAEGAAEAGVDLAFPPDDRARLYRDALLPRSGLPPDRAETLVAVEEAASTLEQAIPSIVAAYLDSRTSRDAALDALARDAAVMDPVTLLAFAERQRTRAVVYVLGRHVVRAWLARQGGDPWTHLASIFSTRALALDPQSWHP